MNYNIKITTRSFDQLYSYWLFKVSNRLVQEYLDDNSNCIVEVYERVTMNKIGMN